MVPKFDDGESSLFPEDSAIWRIGREHVLLLGGAAAAILQIAHPEVALGVAQHSNFRRDSMTRLRHTLEAVYTVTFAPRREVEAMAAHVRAIHARVRGDSPQQYSAFSPDAQMWVLATLIQTSIAMYERFVGPVSPADRESYLRDMRVFGTYFGLATTYGPQNWADFSQYYEGMLGGDFLGSLPVSQELARHVAYPRRPLYVRLLWPLSGFAAREFLPSPLREKLGLAPTLYSRCAARIVTAFLPGILPWVPSILRFAKKYRQAILRDRAARCV
jgi:uncharacterized protein (DUF2236 family)